MPLSIIEDADGAKAENWRCASPIAIYLFANCTLKSRFDRDLPPSLASPLLNGRKTISTKNVKASALFPLNFTVYRILSPLTARRKDTATMKRRLTRKGEIQDRWYSCGSIGTERIITEARKHREERAERGSSDRDQRGTAGIFD